MKISPFILAYSLLFMIIVRKRFDPLECDSNFKIYFLIFFFYRKTNSSKVRKMICLMKIVNQIMRVEILY